jgi:hypothetical protein|tara:strand:+ start:1492 stop:1773 length:282 start_codon:yes stop_codon:yes gene_type:complete
MDTLTTMLTDRVWIYTAIAGSLLGAAFLAYFKGTRAGIWSYSKFDQLLDFLVQRYGWTWFKQDENAWRKRYPKVTAKIDDLEARLAKLENKKK